MSSIEKFLKSVGAEATEEQRAEFARAVAEVIASRPDLVSKVASRGNVNSTALGGA